MSGKQILEDLSQGKLDHLETRVKSFLMPILKPENVYDIPKPSDLNTCGLFCVKLFHASIPFLGSQVKNDLVQTIVLCCHCYTKCKDHVKLQSPLTVHKLLFHIISKLSSQEQGFLTQLIEIADFLYEELRVLEDDQQKSGVVIVMNSYTSLWNTALSLETDNEFTSFDITAHIRFVAIKFLTLYSANNSSLGEKIELVFTRFNQLQSKRKDKAGSTPSFLFVVERFCEMLQLLLKNPDQCCHIFKLVVGSVKHLLHHGFINKFEGLLETVKLAEETSHLDGSFLVSDAVCFFVNTLVLLDKFMKNETVDVDALIKNLTSLNQLISDAHVDRLPLFVMDTIAEGYLSLLNVLNNIGLYDKSSQLCHLVSGLFQMLDACYKFFPVFIKNMTDVKKCGQIRKAILETYHVKLQLQYWLLHNAETDDSLQKITTELFGAKNGGSTKETVADWSVSTLNTYLHELETSDLETKVKMEEKYYCGYMMAKLGQTCFSKSLDNAALNFFKTACSQLTQWCYANSEIVTKRVREASLWKIYNCLADCQRRLGLWQDGMETIVACLVIDCDHMTNLMRMWFQVKKDSVKGGFDDVMNITVKDLLLKKQAKLDDKYIVLCLQAELEAFHSSMSTRKKYPEGEAAILNALITTTSDPYVKAVNLMKLAQLLWLTQIPSEKLAKECVCDVLHLLETSTAAQSCLVLGEANLWKFIMANEDMCKEMFASKSDTECDSTGDDKDDVDNALFNVKLYSLPMAEKDCVSLTTALELWEKGISKCVDIGRDVETLVNSMLICAALFKLCRKPLEEIRVLTLALKVSSDLESEERYFKVTEKLSCVLLQEGFFDEANQLISSQDDALSDEQKAALSILKGRYQLGVGEIAASFCTVENNPISEENKGWSAFLLEGKRKRLLSQILFHSNHARPPSQLSPLVLAHEAVRAHTGVVQFLLGKDFVKADNSTKGLNLFEKWHVLDELLQSLLHLAQMYRHVGQARDARCYLREGTKISRAMCIPRWYANFLLEMSRVQSMAGGTDESIRLLTEVALILGPETDHKRTTKPVLKFPAEAATAVVKDVQHQFHKTERLDSFGEFAFENVRDAGLIPVTENKTLFCSVSPGVYSQLQIRNHDSGCKCSVCGDYVAQKLSMMHSLALGEAFVFNGLLEKGDTELKTIEDQVESFQRMGETKDKMLQDQLCKVMSNVPALQKTFVPNSKKADCVITKQKGNQDVILLQAEMYRLLAKICLQNGNPDLVKMYSNKASRLLHHNVGLYSFHEVQIQFLSVQADMQKAGMYHISPQTVRTPEQLQRDSVSELTDKMIRCRLFHGDDVKPETDVDMEVVETEVFDVVEDNSQNTLPENEETSSLPDDHESSSLPKNKKLTSKQKLLGDSCVNNSSKKEPPGKLDVKTVVKNNRRGKNKKDQENTIDTPVTPQIISAKRRNGICPTTKVRKTSKEELKDLTTCPTGHFSPYNPIKRKSHRDNKASTESCGDSKSVSKSFPSCVKTTLSEDVTIEMTGEIGESSVDDIPVFAESDEQVSVCSQKTLMALEDSDGDFQSEKPKPKGRMTKRGQTATNKKMTNDKKKENEQDDIEEGHILKLRNDENVSVPPSKQRGRKTTNEQDDIDKGHILKPRNDENVISHSVPPSKQRGRKTTNEQDDIDKGHILKPRNDENVILHSVPPSKQRGRKATKNEDFEFSVNENKARTKKVVEIVSSQNMKPGCLPCLFSNRVHSNSSKLVKSQTSAEDPAKSDKDSVVFQEQLDKKTTTCRAKREKKDFACSTKPDKEIGGKSIQALKTRNTNQQKDKNKSGTSAMHPAKSDKESIVFREKLDKKTTCPAKREKRGFASSSKVDKETGIKSIPGLKSRNTNKQQDKYPLSVAVESAMIYDFDGTDSPVAVVKGKPGADRGKKRTVKPRGTGRVKRTVDEKETPRLDIIKTDVGLTERIFNDDICNIQDSCTLEDRLNGDEDLQNLQQSFEIPLPSATVLVECDYLDDRFDVEKKVSDCLNSFQNQCLADSVPPEYLLDSPEVLRADRKKQSKTDGKENVAVRGRKRAGTARTTKVNPVEITDKENVDVNSGDIDNDQVTSTLEKAFNEVRHFPGILTYPPICRLLALQYLKSDPYKTAFYLMEASAVTLRHQALLNMEKKNRKLMKEENLSCSGCESSVVHKVNAVRKELLFDKDVQHFTHMVESLPAEWTVCQFSVVVIPANQSRLFLTRLRSGQKPVTVELPGFTTHEGQNILPEFFSIMESSRESMKVTDKNVWWQMRRELNNRMQDLLESVETDWLGCWKGLLLGLLHGETEQTSLRTAAESLSKKAAEEFDMHIGVSTAEILIEASNMLSIKELATVVSTSVDLDPCSPVLPKLFEAITAWKLDQLESAKRHPVLLILDKAVQHLPWESIPILYDHPVTRIPSLIHLHAQLQHVHINKNDVFVKGVNPKNTFFVLNPDKDLQSTQKTFEDMFVKEFCWSGVVGEKPSAEQLSSALITRDLFVYCGHGSGSKYFHGDDLQLLCCRAAVLLMGCGSGELQVKGQLEAAGMILNYFLSGCSCIVANLWDVTDKDIDRFLESLLRLWTTSEPGTSLLDIIPKARQACRLTSLIGAAPVVYGLPIFLQK